jgi:peptide/nickel transport system substrate-binding protein
MMTKIFIEQQQKKLANGVIDRRHFMMSVLATGLAVPTVLSLADKAEAAAPNRGGLFRMGIAHGSTTDTLDSATSENHFTLINGYTFGNHLTEVSNTGELIPELAESYESSDAQRWVFNLRQGVEFHNGKTMTSEDVIASLAHHMGEDSTSAAKGLLTAVKSVTADGKNRVIFDLESANADFPYIVSDYHISIRPAGDMASGIGTGGYILQSFEPGVKTVLQRNPNYWKDGRAHFDEVELISIIDPTARQTALMNGDIDAMDRVDLKTINLFKRNPNVNILEITGTAHYTFPMRLNVDPFGDYDLRMALKHSIKRQELVDKILLGYGAVGNDHPISTANRYHNSDLPQREFDADKAAHHYKKSGHSGKIQLSASDAAFAGAVDAAQLIANSASEAGIEIEVVREPNDGYWSNVWNNDAKGWCACYWGGRPTEDWMFSAAYTNDTEWNDTAWKGTDSSKKFNSLVKEARAELSDTKRRELYYECQSLISDDGGSIVPLFNSFVSANSKAISTDKQIAANWDSDGAKCVERWWFA